MMTDAVGALIILSASAVGFALSLLLYAKVIFPLLDRFVSKIR